MVFFILLRYTNKHLLYSRIYFFLENDKDILSFSLQYKVDDLDLQFANTAPIVAEKFQYNIDKFEDRRDKHTRDKFLIPHVNSNTSNISRRLLEN